MRLFDAVKHRPPAKSLGDMDVPDTVWKQDFDIADRYQGYANELMRIALLGIAVYGFLIREMLIDKNELCQTLLNRNKILVSAGAISLGLSLIVVLAHRFLSTACLYHQVLIVRSLKRLSSSDWNEEEKKKEEKFLGQTRKVQQTKNWYARKVLACAAILFGLGFIFFISLFIRALFLVPQSHP
jgi:hypothetical protein